MSLSSCLCQMRGVRKRERQVERWRGRSTYSMRLASLLMRPLAHIQNPNFPAHFSLLLQPLFFTLSSIASSGCSNTYQTQSEGLRTSGSLQSASNCPSSVSLLLPVRITCSPFCVSSNLYLVLSDFTSCDVSSKQAGMNSGIAMTLT